MYSSSDFQSNVVSLIVLFLAVVRRDTASRIEVIRPTDATPRSSNGRHDATAMVLER
jgi:hypothetical protein